MYILSHKRKFIFIHVPKVAGRSMSLLFNQIKSADANSDFLYKQYRTIRRTGIHLGFKTYPFGITRLKAHATAKEVEAAVRKKYFENYFKFGFVRNPWDRQLSFYNWLLKLGPNQGLVKHKPIIEKQGGFNNFLKWYHLSGDPQADFVRFWHIQKNFLYADDGTCLVDFVGRFEKVGEDFELIRQKIDLSGFELPHRNKSRKSGDYRSAFTDESIELIAEVCKADIETFGYTF